MSGVVHTTRGHRGEKTGPRACTIHISGNPGYYSLKSTVFVQLTLKTKVGYVTSKMGLLESSKELQLGTSTLLQKLQAESKLSEEGGS